MYFISTFSFGLDANYQNYLIDIGLMDQTREMTLIPHFLTDEFDHSWLDYLIGLQQTHLIMWQQEG